MTSNILKNVSSIDILIELKQRYKNELAIIDYIEMIECEVMAIERRSL